MASSDEPAAQGRSWTPPEPREAIGRFLSGPVGDPLPVGSLQLLGLGAIRERLGERWPRVASMIALAAEHIISRRLTPVDLHVAIDEERYLLIFGDVDEPTARRRAEEIAAEIHERLCGSLPGGGQLQVTSFVRMMPRSRVDGAVSRDGALGLYHESRAAEFSGQIQTMGNHVQAKVDQSAAWRDDTKIRYEPLWNVRSQVISAYRVVAVHGVSDRRLYPLEGDWSGDDERRCFLDCLHLRGAVDGFALLASRGERAVMSAQVSFSTLASSRLRESYKQIGRRLPDSMQRLLNLTICNVPPGLPEARLAEAIGSLRPLARAISLAVPLDPKRVSAVGDLGLYSVVTRIDSVKSPGERAAELAGFARRASLHHLSSVLIDVASTPLADAAVNAGFSYLGGQVISPLLAEPQPVHFFHPENKSLKEAAQG
jgi:hypothetical protein